jgi:hypothetical protein
MLRDFSCPAFTPGTFFFTASRELSQMSLRKIRRLGCTALAALTVAVFSTTSHATSVQQMSIVDLLDHSQNIVAGRVEKVTDGFDAKGLPYTEVTLKVMDMIRGEKGETYTFRQFGLDKPRTMPDGRVYLGGRPPGWPTWRNGEVAIAFLYPKAKFTGLQTTVGLGYGKMSVGSGAAMSAYDNTGLFTRVNVNRALLDSAEQQMFDTKKGPVNEETFRKFLHRAVEGNWVKNGSITNAKR